MEVAQQLGIRRLVSHSPIEADLDRARVVYSRPPLSEAVQEYHFDPDDIEWKEEFWERLTSDLGAVLPLTSSLVIKPIEATLDGAKESAPYPVRQYSTETKGIVLTVGPAMIGLSLRPRGLAVGYPGWEQANRTALALLATYSAIVASTTISKIIVRYINRIPVVPGDFRLSNYVSRDCPLIPPILNAERNPFRLEVANLVSGNETELRSQNLLLSAGASEENGSHELILRIDEIAVAAPRMHFDNIRNICADLHAAALQAFNTVLSSELLESFEPTNTPPQGVTL